MSINLINTSQRNNMRKQIVGFIVTSQVIIFSILLKTANATPFGIDESKGSSTVKTITTYLEDTINLSGSGVTKDTTVTNGNGATDTTESISITSTTTERYPTLFSKDDSYGKHKQISLVLIQT